MSASSGLLYDVIGDAYEWLGFDVVADAVFRDLVIARITFMVLFILSTSPAAGSHGSTAQCGTWRPGGTGW